MRKIILFILIVLMIASILVRGDVYVKRKIHTDGYYYGGINRPAVDAEDETWITKNKMAIISENRITIIDLEKKKAYIINKNVKTYTETGLPLEMANIVPENIATYLKSVQYVGAVKEKGESKKIGKFACRGFEINSYLMYEGSKANETDSTLWVSTDVPFDWQQYNEMYMNLRRLNNFSEGLLAEMGKIKGFPIASELYFYPKGFSVKTTTEVIEMSEEGAPAGTYSVPEGYTKKEKMSIRDLRNR